MNVCVGGGGNLETASEVSITRVVRFNAAGGLGALFLDCFCNFCLIKVANCTGVVGPDIIMSCSSIEDVFFN